MTVTPDTLNLNGQTGFRFTRQPNLILLESTSARVALPVDTIHAVIFAPVRSPAWLWAAAACGLLGLSTLTNLRPSAGNYEIADWYWWFLGAAALCGAYWSKAQMAVTITSGSYRAVLRGPAEQMEQVFAQAQP